MVEARIAQNLTQKEVAEKTGIAQAELSRMENGLWAMPQPSRWAGI
ncbi:helix-turn-helix transcriptional regulator [uncultured Selenomonas sp.]|nr:helix-turn-helix transcriptional regulator [uncultured Selenomonas sp.]